MTAAAPSAAPPAGLARRLAAFIYEGVLLFAVLFFACFLYVVLTRQKDALFGLPGYVFAFLVPAAYFLYFWTRTGQTLALKTWHLRVVDRHGQPLRLGRALARYVLSWLWVLPGLSLWALGMRGGALAAGLAVWVLTYLMTARLHPERQLPHDLLAGSRVITQLPRRP
jgi:uncharacterized RDD family membrane protein YckC